MQDNLRRRLKQMIYFYGTTQQFVANNINSSRPTINLFLKGERNLSEEFENNLTNFLEERNC